MITDEIFEKAWCDALDAASELIENHKCFHYRIEDKRKCDWCRALVTAQEEIEGLKE